MSKSTLIFPDNSTLLATGVNFVSSYLIVSFCEQVRLCASGAHKPKLLSKNGLFLVMALVTGFVDKFSVDMIHFSSVIALDAEGNQLEVSLTTAHIISALFVAMVSSWIGLYVSSSDAMFAKSKKQIVEMFVEDSKKLSFKQIQSISATKMMFILSTKSWQYLLAGGMIQGSGAIALRCLFIYSFNITDSYIKWHVGYVCAAVVVSWANNILAFWIMFRLTSLYPDREWLRFLSACILTGGSLGVGNVMLSGGITLYTNHPPPPYVPLSHHGFSGSQEEGFYAALISSMCFAFFLMIVGFCDLRSWLYSSESTVHKYEVLITKLKKEHPNTIDTITEYIRKHDSMVSHNSNESSSRNTTRSLRQSIAASPTARFVLGGFFTLNHVVPETQNDIESNNRHHDSISSHGGNHSAPPSRINSRRPTAESMHIAHAVHSHNNNHNNHSTHHNSITSREVEKRPVSVIKESDASSKSVASPRNIPNGGNTLNSKEDEISAATSTFSQQLSQKLSGILTAEPTPVHANTGAENNFGSADDTVADNTVLSLAQPTNDSSDDVLYSVNV